MVGERVPDRCLANPAYRMITVVKFAKHSAPVQKFFTIVARGRLDKEAAIVQKRYVARKIEKDARRDVFAVTDFGGAIASQLQSEQSAFRVFVFGRKGELLQRWDDVPMAEQLAEALAKVSVKAPVVPVVARPGVAAVSNRLRAERSGWDSDFWALQNWHHEG